ncbi:DNA/RNA helicase domain-containing protein [Actinomadura alba]|uniref:DNA/RNA helicase domain-containing protein n=1 Tax=Actinomadura alba TaxID=406431 RepID=UPI0024845AB9|nr:DNA/RNA helicase domain-containing protein [Actinomadura alba]
MEAGKNGLDVLICDEAHRIREVSANQYTPARLRTGRPQVDELIDAARVPVFLLDEHQIVRPGEIGSVEQIPQVRRGQGAPGGSSAVGRSVPGGRQPDLRGMGAATARSA